MITDPHHAIKKALADLIVALPSDTEHTLEPAKVFAELKRQDLLKVVFPAGGGTVAALIKMISLWSGSILLDAQNRPYRLRRVGSAAGFQFTVKFPTATKEM